MRFLAAPLPFLLAQATPGTPPADRTSDGLTLSEIVQALPTDPASLVALALVVSFFGVILWFGTRKPPVKPSAG